ncbi:MAG TPA: hypothetical protein VJK52_04770 [Candidatus Nanoarchaeia archaeon]|nr:hypothetical protein [Candidatus Nanoarchaeia archaeon]
MGLQKVPGRQYFERASDLEMDTTDLVPKPPSPTGFRIGSDMPVVIGVLIFLLILFGILYFLFRCLQYGCRLW